MGTMSKRQLVFSVTLSPYMELKHEGAIPLMPCDMPRVLLNSSDRSMTFRIYAGKFGYTMVATQTRGKKPSSARTVGTVGLWDEFDTEMPEPKDWVATNHEMTEDQRLDDQRHDQCRSGKFVP